MRRSSARFREEGQRCGEVVRSSWAPILQNFFANTKGDTINGKYKMTCFNIGGDLTIPNHFNNGDKSTILFKFSDSGFDILTILCFVNTLTSSSK